MHRAAVARGSITRGATASSCLAASIPVGRRQLRRGLDGSSSTCSRRNELARARGPAPRSGPIAGRALCFVAVIAASVGVLLAVVLAGPAEPVVRWEAPAECGSARELQDRITQQLGALEPGIVIVGRVRRADGLYAL